MKFIKKQIKCSTCNGRFESREAFDQHNSDKHSGVGLNLVEYRPTVYLYLIFALVFVITATILYLSINPVKTSTQQNKLDVIGKPFNASELAAINNEPLSYYEKAGEMLFNGSITNHVGVSNLKQYKPFLVNGKPSVIYIGAISCPMCAQNRWAMALALATFGNFTQLYKGYGNFQEGALTTIYWTNDNYTAPSGVSFGNYYHSNLITFLSFEYDSPIKNGFQIQPITYFEQQTSNSTYLSALSFMDSTNEFQGTPFTFWGAYLLDGADGVVLGDTTSSDFGSTQLSSFTHSQVLNRLSSFNTQFAWSEYAAADIYISMLCPSLNNSVKVCMLPAIKSIEKQLG